MPTIMPCFESKPLTYKGVYGHFVKKVYAAGTENEVVEHAFVSEDAAPNGLRTVVLENETPPEGVTMYDVSVNYEDTYSYKVLTGSHIE